ncbi:MAG: L,D-transpeptidase family protein [Polyangiaceae bacterium]|nr:L,D-transpeptidase family protein [Polyangiaceae bacterium]
MRWPVALALATGLLSGCERKDPPGRVANEARASALPRPTGTPAPPAPPAPAPVMTSVAADPPERTEPGHGARLASIAMRTWIYDAPTERSDKLGYLRAGALIARAELSAGTDGCAGGWYRVAPRGYACVGKGASLDVEHPIVQAAPRAPRRGEPTPYTYVMSDSPAPHMYFRLPSEADQRRVEGPTYRTHALMHAARLEKLATDVVPPFLLAGNDLPKPYGSDKNLSYSVHRGRAPENSAFGLMSVFDWGGRRFGLTTELDLIPLDRTKPPIISDLVGVKLEHGGRPAFVVPSGTATYKRVGKQLQESGVAKGRSGWELTGQTHGGERGLHETTAGLWLPATGLILGELKKDRAKHAERGRKWISVSIQKQLLIAYEGEKPVYAALVSTGRGGMADPEETFATVRGTFMIRAKHVSGTMDGNQGDDEAFDLRDVPYIQYFHEGYALHAAYWHNDFGKTRSHGCVNLTPTDAAWLFDWTDPQVPREWHGAVSPQGGTLVYVHK